MPLDPGCEEAVCHVVLRLKATTLEVLGYAVQGGPLNPVDDATARQIAQDQIDAELSGAKAILDVGAAGLFAASGGAGDLGGYVLIGRESGLIIAAGSITWGGDSADYWAPTEWRPGSEVKLADAEVVAPSAAAEAGECTVAGGPTPGVTLPSEARAVALRSNLAMHIASRGDFSLFTYTYSPGDVSNQYKGCLATGAEHLVIFTQVK